MMDSTASDKRPSSASASGSHMNDQQLGQQQPTFSPTSKLAHSPTKPSPLRQCHIASIPEFTNTSPTKSPSNDRHLTKTASLREQHSADYLRELRTTRAAKLNGSRPPPPSRLSSRRSQRASTSAGETMCPSTSHMAHDEPAETSIIDYRAHSRSKSVEIGHRNVFAGRPLVPTPSPIKSLPLIPDEDTLPEVSTPDASTDASVQRGTGRHETSPLHEAMEAMDLDEEQRIHLAAQDEAAELVYKHRTGQDSPSQAYKNPDIFKDQPKKDYRSHLRTRSALPWNTVSTQSTPERLGSRLTGARPSSSPVPGALTRTGTLADLATNMPQKGPSQQDDPFVDTTVSPRSSKGKSYEKLAGAVASDVEQSRRRASSGSNKRKMSGGQKAAFSNTEVKIFEEPDELLKEARDAEAEKAAAQAAEREAEREAERVAEREAEREAERAREQAEEVPRHVRRNPFARVRQVQEKFERKESPSGYSARRFDKDDDEMQPSHSPGRRFDRIEIHRNPPSRSRQAGYLVNTPPPATPTQAPEELSDVEASPLLKDGIEIRSDDIRAATSMKRKDRSSNLIQPTAVSDSPGRPIVSFQQDWKMKEVELKEERVNPVYHEELDSKSRPYSPVRPQSPFSRPQVQHTASAPPASIPHISLPDSPRTSSRRPNVQIHAAEPPFSVPSIVVPDDPESPSKSLSEEPDIPSIMVQNDTSKPAMPTINEPSSNVRSRATPGARPLPTPVPSRSSPSKSAHSRPLPTTVQTSPLPGGPRTHYTPSVRRNTALCAHCALPIAGRVLSAAGERFHPGCFKCHQCSINLECVAFYPEPEQKRLERLARIHQRQQGLETFLPEGVSEEDAMRLEEADGDEGLRFFCHLDFHEMFSPRCKSCKTPIEGEVVVACGSEWHVGHFFCAQCGDPFDSSTPFVEKEGYAWCVGCHTNRYSAKCKRCRKPVTDVVVKALGAEWHAECFVCTECNGQFEDGRYFLRGAMRDPVCIRCEDRRLKA